MKNEYYQPAMLAEDEETKNLTPAQIDAKVAEDAKEYLNEMDTDKDGSLSEAEIIKGFEVPAEAPDGEGDGDGEVPPSLDVE